MLKKMLALVMMLTATTPLTTLAQAAPETQPLVFLSEQLPAIVAYNQLMVHFMARAAEREEADTAAVLGNELVYFSPTYAGALIDEAHILVIHVTADTPAVRGYYLAIVGEGAPVSFREVGFSYNHLQEAVAQVLLAPTAGYVQWREVIDRSPGRDFAGNHDVWGEGIFRHHIDTASNRVVIATNHIDWQEREDLPAQAMAEALIQRGITVEIHVSTPAYNAFGGAGVSSDAGRFSLAGRGTNHLGEPVLLTAGHNFIYAVETALDLDQPHGLVSRDGATVGQFVSAVYGRLMVGDFGPVQYPVGDWGLIRLGQTQSSLGHELAYARGVIHDYLLAVPVGTHIWGTGATTQGVYQGTVTAVHVSTRLGGRSVFVDGLTLVDTPVVTSQAGDSGGSVFLRPNLDDAVTLVGVTVGGDAQTTFFSPLLWTAGAFVPDVGRLDGVLLGEGSPSYASAD